MVRKAARSQNLAAASSFVTTLNSFSNAFAGIVHHAYMNGSEVAVKSPKVKVALNPRDVRKFEKEVSLQAKVSDAIHFLFTVGWLTS